MDDQEVQRIIDPYHLTVDPPSPVRRIKGSTWEKCKHFLDKFPKWFGLYLGLAGLVTFNLFIMEEAFQTCMFGSWPAGDVGEWRLVKKNLDTMEKLHSTLVIMNRIGGWIHPFAYISYDAYGKSEVEYMNGLRAKVFANCPECFDGEKVTIGFKAQEAEFAGTHWILRNGGLTVLVREQLRSLTVTGIVKINQDGNAILDTR